MIHLGDITKIKGNEAPTVDCIIGGSPCQDLSLAGKRAGLAGARSGLYMEQIRIIKEMRENDRNNGRTGVDIRPRYMVWENVPGAFSTNKGQDFAAVLEEAIRVAEPEAPSIPVPEKGWPTAGCIVGECWSVAWRVLDAQFWGTSDKPLPQRRRRIALIADFGGLSAPQILFVSKGVSGNLEPGKPKGKEAPRDVGESSGGAIGCDLYNGALSGDKAVSLNTNANATGAGPTVAIPKAVGFPLGFRPENVRCYDEMATTLCNGTRPGFTTGVIQERCVISVDQGGGKSGANSYEDVSPTLTCTHDGAPAVAYAAGFCVQQSAKTRGVGYEPEQSPTLCAGSVHGVAYTYDARGNGDGQKCATLTGDHQNRVTDYTSVVLESVRHIVRRLTPLECERLQGFPDGWTDIGEWVDTKGKKHKEADSPRYKALGNSIALPPWKWTLKRLCACYERDATMASLFDGIGGFPYIWEQLNGKGSCLWASEIEEFPIAVTKLRFGGND